ncbi:MAG: nucleoside hydrolase [Oscillospiraceae bacterium]|nr:nucleoside hydrolase [Oscillospiraceae bacterium]
MRRFIMDCDTGGDDASAIVLAVASNDIELLGVTACMGNLPLYQTYRNARELIKYLGVPGVPVLKGSERPLTREYWVATEKEHYLRVEGITRDVIDAVDMDAVEWMAKTLRESEEKITLIPLAPLTNIAKLMFAYPDLVKEKVDEIIIMGGGMYFGNTSGAAELNIYADPEAAQAVFSFGTPVVMCGLDVCYRGYITPEENQQIREIGNKVANVFSSVVQRSLDTEDPTRSLMYDSIPVVYALYPEIFTTVTASVEVECGSELCDGMTVCEPVKPEGRRCWSNAPKIHKVVLDVDREAYVEAVKRILRESEY